MALRRCLGVLAWGVLATAGLAGAAEDEFEGLGIVDDGVGVGAGHHGGDATRSSSQPCRSKTFLMPLAGFTHLHPDINDAGGQMFPVAVDDLVKVDSCQLFFFYISALR